MSNRQPAVHPKDAERPFVVALDVGSSSVRAGLYDCRGRLIEGCLSQLGYAWEIGPEGSVRLPAAALLEVAGQALDGLATAAGPLAREAVAGGIACFFHSIVGLDDAGRPLTSVLSWADTSAGAEARALRASVDPEGTHQRTGAPIHPGYWPARVVRLRREQPAIRRWAGFTELLAELLTGRAVTSISMASGTGLLDRVSGAWSSPLLERLELDPGQLPALWADDRPIGMSGPRSARRWPTFAHLAWFPVWGDGACGNVGLGVLDPGRAALMIGTSGALRSMVPEPDPFVGPGLFAYRLGTGTLLGGQLSEGGGTVAWIAGLLRRSPAALERAAAQLEPDGHGLTILPFVAGERGLGYHEAARGVFAGLAGGTDAASIYRALLESIAYRFAALDARLTAALPGKPEIVAGGGALTRSPLWAQIVADALGRDIQVASRVEASLRGAAILALRGSGLLGEGKGEGATPAPVRSRLIRADPDRAARYEAGRARQEALYATLLD